MDQGGTIGRFAEGVRRRRARRHTSAALWSVVASLCAATAVMSALSDHGRERVALLFEDPSTRFAKADPAADMAELHGEVARLRSRTRMLAIEREALATRMAELESAGSPITGSLGDETEIAGGRGTREVYPRMPEPESDPDEPRGAPPAEASEPKEPDELDLLAEVPRPAENVAPQATTPATRTRFALEIGEAASEDQVRTLWRRLSGDHADILDGLDPKVAIAGAEDGEGRLRLRAGPIENAADAMRSCVELTRHEVPCTPVSDRGDPLDLGAAD